MNGTKPSRHPTVTVLSHVLAKHWDPHSCAPCPISFECFEPLQGISCFQAKIGIKNVSSLKLFEKLGYTEVSRSKVFNEATLRLEVSDHVSKALLQQAESLHVEEYDNC